MPIDRIDFDPVDYAHFGTQVRDELATLRRLLSRPGFGEGPPSIGAELELHLIDAHARPSPCNDSVVHALHDPKVTFEINRFNIELNASPLPLAGRPFGALQKELRDELARIEKAAATYEARVAAIGILPTLRLSDLGPAALSTQARYLALSRALRRQRGAPFEIHIDGLDPLHVRCEHVALEGANTSFQLHLRVPPKHFARHYNAAQLAAAPLLAVAGNSPFFAECRLWEETRIPLFKQAVDARRADERTRVPARVSFGHGWVRDAAEPFSDSVFLHAPLLPVVDPGAAQQAFDFGEIPSLEALRLHHSTVWNWNRAVFDPSAGGHLRIEHRVLPAGPSIADMVANAAFALGLTLGLAERVDRLLPSFSFEQAGRNFYAAAEHGLESILVWPEEDGARGRPRRARELVLALIPEAARGLRTAGVAEDEFEPLLGSVRARAETGSTGAEAQRRALATYARRMPWREALAATLEYYLEACASERPVHTWKRPATMVSFARPPARN